MSITTTTSVPVQTNDVERPINADGLAKEALLARLDTMNVKPLWAQMKRVNPPLPNPTAIPFVWRYNELRPQLRESGDLISEKEAERRVLMLVNPKKGKHTSLLPHGPAKSSQRTRRSLHDRHHLRRSAVSNA